jgi:hypothetical protein
MTQKTASKFTPGPWLFKGRMKDGPRSFVVEAGTWTFYAGKEANARLIAKAPEMYELLELLDWFATWLTQEKDNIRPPHGDEWKSLVKAARRIKAAIDGEG